MEIEDLQSKLNVNDLIKGTSEINFGSTSDNSSFTGGMKFFGSNSVLTSNTADNGTFLPSGQSIESSVNTITINGANTLKGNISVVGGSKGTTLNINKNQSSIGTINLADNRKLFLNIGSEVTKVAFADNSTNFLTDSCLPVAIT